MSTTPEPDVLADLIARCPEHGTRTESWPECRCAAARQAADVLAAAPGVQPDTRPATCACDGQTLLQVHTPGGCYDVAPARPVPDTERRAGYAETLAIADGWEWGPGLSSVPSGIIERYLKAADAVLAVADEEQRDLRADRDRLHARLKLVTAETVADVVGPNIDLLCEENARLRAELESANESARKALEQRQEMAEERYVWQERGDRAEALAARLCAELAASERIRENADFHLGQEMARRQLAEKEADRLRAELEQARATTLDSGAKRNEIRQSYLDLAAQAREDRDFEGEADVAQALRRREEQWAREDDAAARSGGPAEDGAQPTTAVDPDVVAYRNSDRPGVLLCREHGDGRLGLTPLTSEDLPDGGTCTFGDPGDPDDRCGVDVLIPQQ